MAADTSLRIRTDRMELIAESFEIAMAAGSGREALGAALDAFVPEDWPPEIARNAIALFAAQLRRDPGLSGWLGWYWVIVDPAGGGRTLAGYGGFTSRPANGTIAIGYSLLPRFMGKGYATEAVGALVHWAFSQPGVCRVIAEVLPGNGPSVRVLQRSGFRQRGIASEPGHIRFEIDLP